jgi:hypothetical protein
MDADALLANSACILQYTFFLTVINDQHRSFHIHELAYVFFHDFLCISGGSV